VFVWGAGKVVVGGSGHRRSGRCGANPENAVRDAGTAMYQAKAQGKARVVMFDRAMHEQCLARLELEADLREVVERGELSLH